VVAETPPVAGVGVRFGGRQAHPAMAQFERLAPSKRLQNRFEMASPAGARSA
jgi:hypothetical protein